MPPLTDRDANANDMLDSFNFFQKPNPPLILQTRQCPILSTANVKFANTAVNSTSLAHVVTLTNLRTKLLHISSLSVTGDFTLNACALRTLNPNTNCALNVTFKPTATGIRTGTLTVVDDDPSSPQVVTLTGMGSVVQVMPTGISFNKLAILGTKSTPVNITLTNTGASPLAISKIVTKGEFSQTNTCGTSLAAGTACKIAVVFGPVTSGIKAGNVAIYSNDVGSPQILTLVGTSTAGNLVPSVLTFPAQKVGTPSIAKPVTLTNAGNVPLIIGSTLAMGDFSQNNNCPSSLLPHTSCTLSVTFSPSAVGTRTGSISISDNDGSSPQTVTLSGTGD